MGYVESLEEERTDRDDPRDLAALQVVGSSSLFDKPAYAVELVERLQLIISKMLRGCGNHGCVIQSPQGMGTNGACRCRPRRVPQQ